ncbi:MAG: septum formation protein Maf [Planctomycetes bacterium]|nr:septum formation protein Maf [Planctomycetota bacterium]
MTDAPDTAGPTFVLASRSPRRRQLLLEAGYRFTVIAPPLAEPPTVPAAVAPSQHAESLAYFKARSVVERYRPTLPVLGADTVVALGDRLFGKPADAADARRILAALSGTRHEVITGVALIDPDGCRLIASDVTHVRMRPMGRDELEAYIASGLWEGKAGAYGIQDRDDPVVERIEGSFSNVVGLPLEQLPGLFAQLVMRHAYEELR